MQVLTSAKEILIDGIEITTVKSFFGKLYHADGTTDKTVEEFKTELKKGKSDAEWEQELSKRTRRIRFKIKKIELDKLIKLHAEQTTIYKKWYNDNKIAKLSEGEIGELLTANPKEIVVTVDNEFWKSSRKSGKGKVRDFKADLMDKMLRGEITLEEAQAEIEKISKELEQK